ncbi:RipA family octameric membrane protein [Amycolatopsis sacchari]|uniref:RipA family octameric membrane protein n=1 Tax=Amycolatopsis sacchari TaxID=115433 RepID=UPI003EB81B2F
MTEPGASTVNPTDAQVGYQAAVSLWASEGNMVWAKFNALLVANSIVLAIYGLALGSAKVSRAFIIGLPIAGIVLCMVWWTQTKRGFDYFAYWISSARELEESCLSSRVKTITRGGSFAEGRPVSVTVNGRSREFRMSRSSRLLKANLGAYAVIGVFAALYVVMLFN